MGRKDPRFRSVQPARQKTPAERLADAQQQSANEFGQALGLMGQAISEPRQWRTQVYAETYMRTVTAWLTRFEPLLPLNEEAVELALTNAERFARKAAEKLQPELIQ
jgi:hypothetical protein